jgi:hypothetical protein
MRGTSLRMEERGGRSRVRRGWMVWRTEMTMGNGMAMTAKNWKARRSERVGLDLMVPSTHDVNLPCTDLHAYMQI